MARLSILFTPVFSSYYVAKNWKYLGEPERQKKELTVLYFNVMLLFIIPALSQLKTDSLPLPFGVFASILWIYHWYVRCGKKQVDYVNDKLGKSYEKRNIATPILIGVVATGLYYIAVMAAIAAFYRN